MITRRQWHFCRERLMNIIYRYNNYLSLTELFTVNNNNLPLIKTFTVNRIFTVNNNYLPLIKLLTVNNNNLPLIKIVAVTNNYLPLMKLTKSHLVVIQSYDFKEINAPMNMY